MRHALLIPAPVNGWAGARLTPEGWKH